MVQIVYDGTHALLRQFSWKACQDLDGLGHLLRVVLTLGSGENLAEESGFELDEVVLNHLLA